MPFRERTARSYGFMGARTRAAVEGVRRSKLGEEARLTRRRIEAADKAAGGG